MEIKNLQKLDQRLNLNPQMLTSLELLSYSNQEVMAFLREECQSNPALDCDAMVKNDHRKADGQDMFSDSQPVNSELQSRYDYAMDCLSQEESLSDFLIGQLGLLSLPAKLKEVTSWIIYSLDPNGYFLDSEDIPEDYQPYFEEAIKIVQSFQPTGVGARNLEESLLLQVSALGIDDPILIKLITHDLVPLSHRKFREINQKYKIENAIDYLRFIQTLNPRPATSVSNGENAIFVRPEMTVERQGSELHVIVHDDLLPPIQLIPGFSYLLDHLYGEDREYFLQQRDRVKILKQSLDKRQQTLLTVGQSIVSHQTEFFLGNRTTPAPMTMQEISEKTGLSLSTISRAVKDKYIRYN